MIQNLHRRIAVDLAEDNDDRQVHRVTVQPAAGAATAKAAAVAVADHQRNTGKTISHHQATWIKFDRYEHQHRQS